MDQVYFEFVSKESKDMRKVHTYWLGLSRRPPRSKSWQQQRMYLIRPSRLKKPLVRDETEPRTEGPPRQASMSGQQPPTQWL